MTGYEKRQRLSNNVSNSRGLVHEAVTANEIFLEGMEVYVEDGIYTVNDGAEPGTSNPQYDDLSDASNDGDLTPGIESNPVSAVPSDHQYAAAAAYTAVARTGVAEAAGAGEEVKTNQNRQKQAGPDITGQLQVRPMLYTLYSFRSNFCHQEGSGTIFKYSVILG